MIAKGFSIRQKAKPFPKLIFICHSLSQVFSRIIRPNPHPRFCTISRYFEHLVLTEKGDGTCDMCLFFFGVSLKQMDTHVCALSLLYECHGHTKKK